MALTPIRHTSGSGTTQGPAVFSLPDLHFALAWSAAAPGWGGWRVCLCDISTGEMLEVTPPGAEVPVFLVLPRAGHVEVVRERPIDLGGSLEGGQVLVACVPTLRDAVLMLCPLDLVALAAIDATPPSAPLMLAGDF